MFRDMRKQERKLTTQEAQQILSANQYGILSTVCEDGYPYGVPLSYSYLNGKIYFHGTSAGGLKDENITNCEKLVLQWLEIRRYCRASSQQDMKVLLHLERFINWKA